MEGGTTFHFVTGGFEEALVLARKAVGSKDVKIGGGLATVRQYLGAGLIDSLHIVSAPVLLGQGESLFDGLHLHALGFSLTERKTSEYATHLVFEKA
jgi:dihydrofolate reductase